MKKLNIMYFSPTSTTKRLIEVIGERMLENSGIERAINHNFTLPKDRERALEFDDNDILLIGVPVYAGRVPNILLKYLNEIKGNNTLAIPVVVYGNRHYDDALIELNDILIDNGFRVIAGGAFIGEHSFSKTLAKDRPDNKDLSIGREFADEISKKLEKETIPTIEVKGKRPYRPYYKPRNKEDKPVDIRKVMPKTNDNCIDCKICAEICPMGSIPYNDVKAMIGICIKCCACVKLCPSHAKYFDDLDYLRHKRELEEKCIDRKEPEYFF